MPTYKLTYFPFRGLGEVPRQLFHLSGTPFEDERIEPERWPDIKDTTPFGKMPVLDVDGVKIPQSYAITRYLARQFGFAGKTPIDEAWVDAIADQYKDYHLASLPYFVVVIGKVEGDKEKLAAEIGVPKRDEFFAQMEKILEDNGSGFLVGDGLTWIDLYIAELVDFLLPFLPGWLDAFPKVVALRHKVQSIRQIKEWLEKRPVTTF